MQTDLLEGGWKRALQHMFSFLPNWSALYHVHMAVWGMPMDSMIVKVLTCADLPASKFEDLDCIH